jgi:hypothetical protein
LGRSVQSDFYYYYAEELSSWWKSKEVVMFRLRELSVLPGLILLSLPFLWAGLVAPALAQKPSPSPAVRRPLPKPASGARGFEQYGREASSRLIAAGATRGMDALEPNAPIEGLAYAAQPFFSWGLDTEAKAYHFVLYEGDVYSNPSARIVFEQDVAANELAYPKDAPALRPGELYSWRTFRIPADKSSGSRAGRMPATFFILAGKDAEEIREALAKANLSSPQTAADQLRQARLFEEFGIWYDALRITNEILMAHPDDAQANTYYDALLSKLERKPE